MRKNLVMTITGNDKVGIVEEVTGLVLSHGGNVESSKMARLGGSFAMLMLVSVSDDQFESLRANIRNLANREYKISTSETEQCSTQKFSGWTSCDIEVHGADHEGIIHEITRFLAEQGVSVETMDTGIEPAPMSGGNLFMMTAIVLVPPQIDVNTLTEELEDVGDHLNVDASLVIRENL